MSHTTFNIQHDEQVLLTLRKHWFMLVRDAIGVIFVGMLLPVLGSLALSVMDPVSNTVAALFIFVFTAWFLLVWIALAIIWTNHYLDMWVITDRRIVHVEQVRLFVREVTTLPLERVQDATLRYNGFIETMLDFGTIHVQSAGAGADEVVMHGMPHPNDVKRMILACVDAFREAHVYVRPEGFKAHRPEWHDDTV